MNIQDAIKEAIKLSESGRYSYVVPHESMPDNYFTVSYNAQYLHALRLAEVAFAPGLQITKHRRGMLTLDSVLKKCGIKVRQKYNRKTAKLTNKAVQFKPTERLVITAIN